MPVIILLLVFLASALIAAVFSVNALYTTLKTGLPYVTTPQWAIDWLTSNLQLTTSDFVYELGCGDARVLAALAKKFPDAKFIGIEIQWWPYLLALWRTRSLENVTITHGDFLRTELSPATLVYGFYITVMAPKVGAKLVQDLRPGARAISYGFALPGLTEVESIANPKQPKGSKIRMYRA